MNQSPAELRNAAARQLIARGKLRQALDVLNEAVRLDPRLPDSYYNRSEVFEQLGMAPQAEADRRKFSELGGVIQPADPEAPATRAKPKVRRRPAALEARYPSMPASPNQRSTLPLQTVGTTLVVLGLLGAAAIGIYLGLQTLSDAISSDDGGSAAANVSDSPTPAPTDEAGNTFTPSVSIAPTPESLADALTGSPYAFAQLQAAWQSKGIASEATQVNTDLTGFSTTPVNVTLSKGDAEMHLAVLFYDSPSGPSKDWALGSQVTPFDGRDVPNGSVAWYNSNAVVVVLDQDATIKGDAFSAFISLSG